MKKTTIKKFLEVLFISFGVIGFVTVTGIEGMLATHAFVATKDTNSLETWQMDLMLVVLIVYPGSVMILLIYVVIFTKFNNPFSKKDKI